MVPVNLPTAFLSYPMDPHHSQIMLKFAQFRTYHSLETATTCLSSSISRRIHHSSRWSVVVLHSWAHFLIRLLISRPIIHRSATAADLALVEPAFLLLFSNRPTRVVIIPPRVPKFLFFSTSIPLAGSLSVVLVGFGGNSPMLMGAYLH